MTTRRLTFFLPLFFAGLAIDADGAGKVVRDIEFARVDEQSLKLDPRWRLAERVEEQLPPVMAV